MYGASNMSEISKTNPALSGACGGASEFLISDLDNNNLASLTFLILLEIILVMTRADYICTSVM